MTVRVNLPSGEKERYNQGSEDRLKKKEMFVTEDANIPFFLMVFYFAQVELKVVFIELLWRFK